MILKKCRYAILNTEEKFVEENVDIRIVNGRIVDVGEELSAEENEPLIDCSKLVAIPGIVDPHTHIFTYSLRGKLLDIDWDLFWDEVFKHKVLLETSIIRSFIIRNGCSVIITYDPPEFTIHELKIPLLISGRYIRDEERRRFNEQFVHVDSLRRISPEFFTEIVKANRESTVSVHISNTRNYVFSFKKKYGDFPVSYIEKLGGLRENVVLVGLEWVTSREIDLIREAKAKVILTPQCSLMCSPGGFPPVKEFIEKRIPVAIGSCSLTCSSGYFFDELRELIRFIRSSYWDFKTTVKEVFKAVAYGASEILKLKCHRIEYGFNTCITLFRASSPNYVITSPENVLENIVMFSQPEDIVYALTPNISV